MALAEGGFKAAQSNVTSMGWPQPGGQHSHMLHGAWMTVSSNPWHPRGSLHRLRPSLNDAMRRLLPLAVVALCLLGGSSSNACEKHLNGHQSGSDTNLEGSKK